MKVRGILGALVLVAATSGELVGQTALGWGGYYCDRWLEDHPYGTSWSSVSDAVRSQSHWIFGYLSASGYTYQRVSGILDPAGVMNIDDAITKWVTKYCQSRPGDTIERAARSLVEYLGEGGR